MLTSTIYSRWHHVRLCASGLFIDSRLSRVLQAMHCLFAILYPSLYFQTERWTPLDAHPASVKSQQYCITKHTFCNSGVVCKCHVLEGILFLGCTPVCPPLCPCVIIYEQFVNTISYKLLVGILTHLQRGWDKLIRFWQALRRSLH